MGTDEFDDLRLTDAHHRASYTPPPSRDTESVDLSFGESASDAGGTARSVKDGFRIPQKPYEQSQNSRSAGLKTAEYKSHGSAYGRAVRRKPAEERPKDSGRIDLEYSLAGPMLIYAEVRPWPEGYDFYGKFASDARESFERTKKSLLKRSDSGKISPHVPYFAYIPQFKQLSSSQWDYYLYMKERLFNGECLPDTDFSYILLFIYELINVEELTGAEKGAELLARIWMLYRRCHPELDKYMSEWMADYCIVYRVPLPKEMMPVICDICARSTVKEFYADAARAYDAVHGTGYFPRIVRTCLSDYSPSRSRYADKIEGFEEKVGSAFDAAVRENMVSGTGLFDASRQRNMKVSRDVFCGSLCSSSIKKRITLTLCTFMRSPESRRTVTEMLKGAENAVRSRHGIKARLSAPRLRGQSAEISAASEEEIEYLKYYDSPSSPLTHEAAAKIEELSWKNTDVLTDGEPFDGMDEVNEDFNEPAGAIVSDGIEAEHEYGAQAAEMLTDECGNETNRTELGEETLMSILEQRSKLLAGAMRYTSEGGSFSEYCRGAGLFADSAAAEINEMADAVIGDIVLEISSGDYNIIDDYRDEIGL